MCSPHPLPNLWNVECSPCSGAPFSVEALRSLPKPRAFPSVGFSLTSILLLLKRPHYRVEERFGVGPLLWVRASTMFTWGGKFDQQEYPRSNSTKNILILGSHWWRETLYCRTHEDSWGSNPICQNRFASVYIRMDLEGVIKILGSLP